MTASKINMQMTFVLIYMVTILLENIYNITNNNLYSK